MLQNLVVIIKSLFDMGLLILIPMFFPLERGDNARALVRGLSTAHVVNHI